MYTQYYNTIYPQPSSQNWSQAQPPPLSYGSYPYAGYDAAAMQPHPVPAGAEYAPPQAAHDPHAAGAYRHPSEPPPTANYYDTEVVASELPPPKQSLRRSIEAGYRIFASLSPHAQYELQRRGRRGVSFRKLAAARHMPVSTLWRTLAIYLLFRRYPEIAEYRHLGVGHVSVVLSVQPEHQLYFLRNAEVGAWSRRQLDQEVKLYHAQQDQARHGSFLHQ